MNNKKPDDFENLTRQSLRHPPIMTLLFTLTIIKITKIIAFSWKITWRWQQWEKIGANNFLTNVFP